MRTKALFIICLFTAACGYPGYYQDSGYDGTEFNSEAGEGFVSGRVVNAQTGRPVEGALVSTSPPTGTAVTNSQGVYALVIPPLSRSFIVGVVADSPGLRQRQSSCATVTPGNSVNADVQLLSNNATECASSCSEGNICLGGICASACNPVCDCDERCEDGRCVPDGGSGSLPTTGGGSSGGGGNQTGCGDDAVQTPNGCVPKPLLGNWRLSVTLTIDMDGNPGTFSDQTEADFAWDFTVYDVTTQNSGPLWRGLFGGGRLVYVGGDRFSSASSGQHPQDRCSGNEELTGIVTLTESGDLTISNEVGTGLIACARVDGGAATQVLTLTRNTPVSRNGYASPVAITNGSWFENPTNISVLSTTGSAAVQ
jgi:hypothetical protein